MGEGLCDWLPEQGEPLGHLGSMHTTNHATAGTTFWAKLKH